MLVACCFLSFGIGGILYNSVGVFMPAVCEDMGYTTAQFSLYFNIRQIAIVALLPLSGILLPKIHPRILVSGACITGAASLVLLSQMQYLWQLYAAGVIGGIAFAFSVITGTAIILKRWFKEKYGMALGISTAFTGIGGMIMNPVGAHLIEACGWRTTALILAGISALCSLPFTLFVMKKCPEELGLTAYGQEVTDENVTVRMEKQSSVPWSKAMFALVMFNAMLIAIPQAFSSHCNQFGISVGRTAIEGAAMSSAFMLGNTSGKLGLGWLTNRLSNLKSILLGVLCVMTGFAIMAGAEAYGALLVGAFLGGISMSVTAIAVPLLVTDFFDASSYDMILSCGNMSTMFIAGIATTAFGVGFDLLQTYRPSLLLMVAIYGLLAGSLIISYRKRDRIIKIKQQEQ